MGTRLTSKERETFQDIIEADISAITRKIVEQIGGIWETTRDKILQERGLDLKIKKKEEIKNEIKILKQELHNIETSLDSEDLNVTQIVELGGKVDKYDRYTGANFHGIPVKNQLDYDIVKRIQQTIDVDAPAKYVHTLASSAFREIAMSGTFEQAQKIYQDFYSLDFRKYGVDIPPRLNEISSQNPTLTLLEPEHIKKLSEKTTTKGAQR